MEESHNDRHTNPKHSLWIGQAAILPGMGVFRGHAGDNHEHSHYAHQLSIGVNGDVALSSGSRRYGNAGLFIAAGTPHQLEPGQVISMYVDPTTNLARSLHGRFRNSAPIFGLPRTIIQALQDCFVDSCSINAGVNRFVSEFSSSAAPVDPRLEQVLQCLIPTPLTAQATRAELALLVGLSESRFSHWFREQTGMPLRSYRKWLRLIACMQQILGGNDYTSSAHAAGFSDQAHFTRTFKETFGLRPSGAFAQITASAG